ncbi:hypothetical protein Q7C36_005549 [Tachysurus vachellii]|uniref:Uncharacterized protein n=1 Tax=Tachysurus vachellii TaxID=175792 RepID=A0AA88NJ68_TACVA|nr:hypothetical protein Q7C36_005549 [Tachysurus vachellii]
MFLNHLALVGQTTELQCLIQKFYTRRHILLALAGAKQTVGPLPLTLRAQQGSSEGQSFIAAGGRDGFGTDQGTRRE